MDKKILAMARRIAVREATAEIINENRKEITKRAEKRVQDLYVRLAVNAKAGKPVGAQ